MTLKKIKQRVKSVNKIIGHLNINLFRNKFVFAEKIIQVFDIFLVSESKLDNIFSTNLFKINDYKIFRYDRNRFWGGLFSCVNEQVPCRLLQGHPNVSNLEILIFKVYQNKRKWLFLGIYKPPNQNDIEFLNRNEAILDDYSQKCDNATIIGDFDITTENTHLQSMMQAHNSDNLIKKPTCFPSNNSNQIDLILTNQKSVYKFSNTFETDLPDHYKLISAISKSGSFKGTPRI